VYCVQISVESPRRWTESVARGRPWPRRAHQPCEAATVAGARRRRRRFQRAGLNQPSAGPVRDAPTLGNIPVRPTAEQLGRNEGISGDRQGGARPRAQQRHLSLRGHGQHRAH